MENGLIKTGSILDIIKNKMQLISEVLLKWESDGTLDNLAKEFTIIFTEIANSVMSAYNFIKENHEVIIALTKFLGLIYVLTKGIFALKAAFEAYQIAVTALSNIGFLVTIFTKLKLAIASFNLMLASTPAGWVTAAIGAIAFALYMLIFEFDRVKSFVGSLWESLKSFADNMPWWASIIVGAFMPIITIIKGLGKVWEWAKSLFSDEDIEKNIEVTEKTKEDIQELAKPQVENKIPSQNKVFEESFTKIEAPQSLNSVKSNAINRATINTPRSAVTNSNNIYIQGDIYGYDEFKEKVAGVIVDISKNNMANVT